MILCLCFIYTALLYTIIVENSFKSFNANAVIKDQKGDIVELIKIGSYEFGEKKLPKKEE